MHKSTKVDDEKCNKIVPINKRVLENTQEEIHPRDVFWNNHDGH